MADSEPKLNQDDIAALMEQVQSGNEALAADTQAVQAATTSAAEIADVAQSAASPEVTSGADVAPMQATRLPAEAPILDLSDAPPAYPPEIRQLLSIEVPIIVQLGIRRMPVGEVMRFAVGAIIEFHKASDEELELLANNKSIGKGHAVKVGENFGIKLTAVGPVKDTIKKLGGF